MAVTQIWLNLGVLYRAGLGVQLSELQVLNLQLCLAQVGWLKEEAASQEPESFVLGCFIDLRCVALRRTLLN